MSYFGSRSMWAKTHFRIFPTQKKNEMVFKLPNERSFNIFCPLKNFVFICTPIECMNNTDSRIINKTKQKNNSNVRFAFQFIINYHFEQ